MAKKPKEPPWPIFSRAVYRAFCLSELFALEAMVSPVTSRQAHDIMQKKLKKNNVGYFVGGPRGSRWPWEEFLQDLLDRGEITVKKGKKNPDSQVPAHWIQREDYILLTHAGYHRLALCRQEAQKQRYHKVA